MSFDLKPNQEKYNFISAYYKLTILTENNVQFLIMKKARKRLFPTFVQTLVLNMTFFFTVLAWHASSQWGFSISFEDKLLAQGSGR